MMYFREKLDNTKSYRTTGRKSDGKQEKERRRVWGGVGGLRRLETREEVESKCDLVSNDLSSPLQLKDSRGSSCIGPGERV